MIEVTTQMEFDAAVKAGHLEIRIIASAHLWITVSTPSNVNVEARGSSHVEAWESSHVVAWGSSHVEAWGSSHVEARESSHVVAWESSHVVAWGNVFIRLFSAVKVKCAASVIVIVHGSNEAIEGGQKHIAVKPKTAKEWCLFWGVKVTKSIAVVFKGVNKDWVSPKGTSYKPGTSPVAPDWDGGKVECGGGLHFSPCPSMTLEFNAAAEKFVACPIKLQDIVVHPDGSYPQKIKAKGVTGGKCYEVDREGNKI